VPTTLAAEKATNPFLRAPLLAAAGVSANAPAWEAFASIRKQKDVFK
jgi:hydroxyacylglutathione hydrolase